MWSTLGYTNGLILKSNNKCYCIYPQPIMNKSWSKLANLMADGGSLSVLHPQK